MHDDEHLLTVGFVPWSLPFHESLYSGFAPLALRNVVDFISVHVYPGHAEATLEETLLTLRAAYVGLPVVIEETIPYVPPDTQWTYYRWTLSSVSGWFGFFLPPRWHKPNEIDLAGDHFREEFYQTFRRFVTTEVPDGGVRRRPGDVVIELPVYELRAGPTGADARRHLLERFRDLDASGQALDVVLR
jgi:hypothetical protein